MRRATGSDERATARGGTTAAGRGNGAAVARRDEAATARAYDTVAGAYGRLLPDLRAEAADEVALLDAFGDRVGGAGEHALVVDVGCGTGRVATHLTDRGLTVLGVDLSPGMLAVARERDPRPAFLVGSATALPLATGCARGVLAWYSLIHTAPSALAGPVAEVARVTAPGGWLLVGLHAGTGERVDHRQAYGHEVRLTTCRHDPSVVAEAVTRAGFAVHRQVVRPAAAHERAAQAFLLARRQG